MARASLSGILDSASGRLGDMSLVRSRSGLVVKSRPTFRRTLSPEQRQAADRMREAGATWKKLTPHQAAEWFDYAQQIELWNSVQGEMYHPTAYNSFLKLAVKVLQVDPMADIPLLPPTTDFLGDSIQVEMSVSGSEIQFAVSAPNSSEVVTELLVQRVSNLRSKPGAQFKSMGFHTFESGSLNYFLPIDSGIYIAAYRFVKVQTGQTTGESCSLALVIGDSSASTCPCCGQSLADSRRLRTPQKAA